MAETIKICYFALVYEIKMKICCRTIKIDHGPLRFMRFVRLCDAIERRYCLYFALNVRKSRRILIAP